MSGINKIHKDNICIMCYGYKDTHNEICWICHGKIYYDLLDTNLTLNQYAQLHKGIFKGQWPSPVEGV